ncbi:SidA/IucD/PvdA family monooxygenase [Nocardioides sp. ChNu-153]|uniref:lysine N(6)-hydroxylase/L-ornithine N(5)-oxygenase family protein n=1 Tax=unclassified Nocardioides TaxID=2615069 RepID=UPI0024059D61|nr:MULTISPECIES: SidA/IucD/PvdA family monooxygenase [unclassified Nocardioides]MDF9715838.1 SidA/IucD/PvdA family monooxygenase [Nocardioides sp. ChNu-99]MDN7120782.1 SidA/IucD/PvdA family monooxygenase [Nocardioides sp. ChNu-153]
MRVHDVVGIGLGPFNLGLACLAEPLPDLDCVFLEARSEFSWHPGMLLPDATLQVPFLADLVTLADPTSPFSFLAYLKEVGRLYPFYVRESFYPMRREYDAYCRWAAERLRSLEFDRAVGSVEWDDTVEGGAYAVRSTDPRTGEQHTHWGRHLVLGVGTRPYQPPALRDLDGPAWHSSRYLEVRDELLARPDVTVVGSGQSAAEIFSDLLASADTDVQLRWVTRSPRFFPLEYTKLTLELTSPEYSAHFRSLPPERRERLLASQAGLYKGISGDLVDQVHEQLYRRSLTDARPPQLLTAAEVTACRHDGGRYDLTLHHQESDETFHLTTSALVTATGYRAVVPPFLTPVADRIRWDERGRPVASEHFTVDHDDRSVFVQNAELHTHGFVAPDLGMGAWRNSVILARVLGHEPYPVERRVAFQEFGVPTARPTEVAR